MEFGVQKTVLDVEGRELTGCYGCDHCQDTGYSWVCSRTGEKLEGFDTMKDKVINNRDAFYSRNILVGVGHKCPLCVVCNAKTPVKFDVDLEAIAKFVKDETCDVWVYEDDIDEGELAIGVSWFEGGYPDDEAHKRWVLDELSEIRDKIEKKFNCKMVEGDCDIDREEILITLE